MTAFVLGGAQVLGHRLRANGLVERGPWAPSALRPAAWAGLTDSVPRAALLSLHARLAGTPPTAWQDPALVQLWGPRYSTYAVAAEDRGVFTVGRTSLEPASRRRADAIAERLVAHLGDREESYADAARALGLHHNALRYATTTGRVLLRWDGARRPTIRAVPPPGLTESDARAELARRYLHVLGPGTPQGFSDWAGVRRPSAEAAFAALAAEVVAVRTPVGDAWALASDEDSLGTDPEPVLGVRLLPSGDAYTLLQGAERALLVQDDAARTQLWPSRVWPGAVLVDGEVVGTWRRAEHRLTLTPWRVLDQAARDAVVEEALALPLPDLARPLSVTWTTSGLDVLRRARPTLALGAIPDRRRGGRHMTADGWTAEERAAMKERAAELRAEGKKGAKKADALQALLDKVAAMQASDRVLAERVHAVVSEVAPGLQPKTWYGMPAYADDDGKVVVFFQEAAKFSTRYATLGFQDAARLDDGEMWPVTYAITEWTDGVDAEVRRLVARATAERA